MRLVSQECIVVTLLVTFGGCHKQDLAPSTTDGVSPGEMTYIIPSPDSEGMEHVADIINSLEHLGVLDPDHKNCYTVDKIAKSVQPHPELEKVWRVGVFFYVREIGQGKGQPEFDGVNTNIIPDRKVGAQQGERGAKDLAKTSGSTSGTSGSVLDPNCMAKISSGGSFGENTTSSGSYEMREGTKDTILTTNQTRVTANEPAGQKNQKKGLSHTQLLVITTCSVVIGIFFIVAFTMRLRYCIKRIQEEQELAGQPFRGCSLILRSHPDQDCVPGSESNQDISLKGTATFDPAHLKPSEEMHCNMSPKLCGQESHPLLIVTSASAPSSPCLTRLPFDNCNPTESAHPEKSSGLDDSPEIPVKLNMDMLRDQGCEDEGDAVDSEDETEHDSSDHSEPSFHNHTSQERLLDFGTPEDSPPCDVKKVRNFLQGKEPFSTDPSSITQDLPVVRMPDDSVYPLGSTGFTQSDSSITSNNPSYRYGNQVEYGGIEAYVYSNRPHIPPITISGPEEDAGGSFENMGYIPTSKSEELLSETCEANTRSDITNLGNDANITECSNHNFSKDAVCADRNTGTHTEGLDFTDNSGCEAKIPQIIISLNSSQDPIENAPEDCDEMSSVFSHSRHVGGYMDDQMMGNDNSALLEEEEDLSDPDSSNLLPSKHLARSFHKNDTLHCDEANCLLLDPAFEGMEPTYV